MALGSLLEVTFVNKNVSFQVPAEITFDLDLSQLESDEIYIRTSKEDLNGFKVNKSQKEWKAVYPFPGYYKAQLIVDNELLRVNDVFVKSFGWMATLENAGKIEYLAEDELSLQSQIGLTEAYESKIQAMSQAPLLTYHYFDQRNPISGLDFKLAAEVKNTYSSFTAPCKNIKLEIVGTNSRFLIPFSITACTPNEPIIIAGREYFPSQINYEKLTVDFSEWQKISIAAKQGIANILIDDEIQLKLPIPASIRQIVGFRFQFEGSGKVKEIKLTDTRDVIYAAPF